MGGILTQICMNFKANFDPSVGIRSDRLIFRGHGQSPRRRCHRDAAAASQIEPEEALRGVAPGRYSSPSTSSFHASPPYSSEKTYSPASRSSANRPSHASKLGATSGLSGAYTGNVVDPDRQSTYCPGCGEMVIGRDWRAITAYRLEGDRCGSCGHRIAGRFGEVQGHWGDGGCPSGCRRADGID